jgi:type IV pilus assembly protein PilV
MKLQLSWVADEGFTLIELMITLVILSIGLLALAGLQVNAIQGNASSKRMTTAASIAERKMEEIKNSTFANVQSESATQVAAAQVDEPNLNFTRSVTVTSNSPLARTKTVNVNVTWTTGSKSHTLSLATIIAQ